MHTEPVEYHMTYAIEFDLEIVTPAQLSACSGITIVSRFPQGHPGREPRPGRRRPTGVDSSGFPDQIKFLGEFAPEHPVRVLIRPIKYLYGVHLLNNISEP